MAKSGRPVEKIGQAHFGEHINSTIEILQGAFQYDKRANRSLLQEVALAWSSRKSLTDRAAPKYTYAVDILRSQQGFTSHHIEQLHHVLGLGAYGLNAGDTWLAKAADSSIKLRDLPSFREMLHAAQTSIRDPLSIVRKLSQNSGVWVGMHQSLQPRPRNGSVVSMVLSRLDEPPPSPPPGVHVFEPKSWVEIRFIPAVTGRLLLLSYRPQQPGIKERLIVLNDHPEFQCPREKIYASGIQTATAGFELTGIVGDNDIACINWPAGLDHREYGKDLFTSGKSDDEWLGNLAAAMMRTADNPKDLRVHAGILTIRVEKPAMAAS